jgi:hypothetical protein
MDQLMKMNSRTIPFLVAAVLLLVGLNAYAETPAGIEDSSDGATDTTGDTETVTVTVTHTDEGIEVVTPKGRHVLLKNDHTWEYLELKQPPAEKSAVLSVVNIKKLRNACVIGFRLTNNLPYLIKSLVPRFSAYTRDQVMFDTLSTSFDSIKPTGIQYKSISFIGITCPDILYIKVHGGDRCTMGPFTKFDSNEGECLKQVYVQESDLIKVVK